MEAKEIIEYLYLLPFITMGIYILIIALKELWELIRDIFDF